MGEDIAPDVSATIRDLCDETTLLAAHGEEPRIEVHEPFEDQTVSYGIPFIAVVERTPDTTTVRAVGHFDYSGSADGLPSIGALRAQHSSFDDRFSTEEREFVEYLIRNQYRPSGPVTEELRDWSDTVYTGKYLVGKHDPDEIWKTGEIIYPNDDPLIDEEDDVGFDEARRDELIEGTIEMLRNFAVDVANVSEGHTYVVREGRIHDFRDRAEELYVGAPPLTQTQAVSWALAEMGLGQTRIATLRDKTQPTIQNHLDRAAKHYVHAEKTANAFGALPRYMPRKIVENVSAKCEEEAAMERFRFEKRLTAMRVKCPECGLDAGEWEGGLHSGDWAEEPTKFWQGSKTLESFQNPPDPRHVECPECGHFAHRDTFNGEWKKEHGSVPDDRPEPF